MVSRIVLNLRSSNSWRQFGDTSAGESLGSRNERRQNGKSLQPSFLTRTICDLDDSEDAGGSEGYVVDVDDVGKDSTDNLSTIPMSSMSIRRKLDSIPCDV